MIALLAIGVQMVFAQDSCEGPYCDEVPPPGGCGDIVCDPVYPGNMGNQNPHIVGVVPVPIPHTEKPGNAVNYNPHIADGMPVPIPHVERPGNAANYNPNIVGVLPVPLPGSE